MLYPTESSDTSDSSDGNSYNSDSSSKGSGSSDTRYYFLLSLVILAVSGMCIVAINTYTKSSSGWRQMILNRGLWKFDSDESKKTLLREKAWHWRKLVFAGIMLDALVMSIAVKMISLQQVLFLCCGLLVLWLLFILFYWYYFVARTIESLNFQSNTDTIDSNNITSTSTNNSNGTGTSIGNSSSSSSSEKETSEAASGWRRRSNQHNSNSNNSSSSDGDRRLPMTIVTGFLGSGKTTLVKNILQNTVGMRILVIENEIGAEGIDHELLMQHTKAEDVILMSNGCVCCTVRRDLISTFHKMFQHDSFSLIDWVVIETTGLADPAPVIQSLYMDDECQRRMRLDGVLAVVDCKHLPRHLTQRRVRQSAAAAASNAAAATPTSSTAAANTANAGAASNDAKLPSVSAVDRRGRSYAGTSGVSEALLQISYADVVLMNKIDLVSSTELQSLVQSVKKLNAAATVVACQNAQVDIDELLNIKAFDPSKNAALLPDVVTAATATDAVIEEEEKEESKAANFIQFDAQSGSILRRKISAKMSTKPRTTSSSAATAAVGSNKGRHRVSTVSLVLEVGPLNLTKFNSWVSELLRVQGEDILRLKGILWMHGYEEQFVVHGIHMIFDGRRGQPWNQQQQQRKKQSRLVLIGINLDAADLQRGFASCAA